MEPFYQHKFLSPFLVWNLFYEQFDLLRMAQNYLKSLFSGLKIIMSIYLKHGQTNVSLNLQTKKQTQLMNLLM